jgi:hypothetical protein
MIHQPIPQVTSEDVERIVLRDFGETQFSLVMWILEQYGKQPWNRPSPRVRLAILKLASGNLDRLVSYTQNAIDDYRNVIGPAEYPTNQFENDWKQYCDSLTRRKVM